MVVVPNQHAERAQKAQHFDADQFVTLFHWIFNGGKSNSGWQAFLVSLGGSKNLPELFRLATFVYIPCRARTRS
jgi:hypothetical protein